MNTIARLEELSLKLDQLDQLGEWISESMTSNEASVAEAGAMISALAEDVRLRLLETVAELEKEISKVGLQIEAPVMYFH
jgi:hypothetical protein